MIGVVTPVGIVIFENEETAKATLGPNLQDYNLLPAVGPASALVNGVVREVLLSASPVMEDKIAQRVVADGGSEEEVNQVIEMLDTLVADEDRLSDERLAAYLLKKCKGHAIEAIKALRQKRGYGLSQARDLVYGAQVR